MAWKSLGIVLALGLVLAIGAFIYVGSMLGHSDYVVEGVAVVRADALSRVKLPALVCSGHGGPLGASGVHGQPLGNAEHASASLVCTAEGPRFEFPYEEHVHYGSLPRNMHVYAWLEHRPELLSACQRAGTPSVEVPRASIRGHDAELLLRPCGKGPVSEGPLGYAVTFETALPGNHEVARIEVGAGGFP